jgi:hypothetical protein
MSSVPAAECGTMQLAGLGAADWAYAFGPAFEPDGRCFDVDGTLTLTLQSDGSTISGPLTGLFCPGTRAHVRPERRQCALLPDRASSTVSGEVPSFTGSRCAQVPFALASEGAAALLV